MISTELEKIINSTNWTKDQKQKSLVVLEILSSETMAFFIRLAGTKYSEWEIGAVLDLFTEFLEVLEECIRDNEFEEMMIFFDETWNIDESNFGEYQVPMIVDLIEKLEKSGRTAELQEAGVRLARLFFIMDETLQLKVVEKYLRYYLMHPRFLYNFQKKFFFEVDATVFAEDWGENFIRQLEENQTVLTGSGGSAKTVSEWISNFVAYCLTRGDGKVSNFLAREFLAKSPDVKILNAQEKELVGRLLRLYTWICYPHLDPDEALVLADIWMRIVDEVDCIIENENGVTFKRSNRGVDLNVPFEEVPFAEGTVNVPELRTKAENLSQNAPPAETPDSASAALEDSIHLPRRQDTASANIPQPPVKPKSSQKPLRTDDVRILPGFEHLVKSAINTQRGLPELKSEVNKRLHNQLEEDKKKIQAKLEELKKRTSR